VAEPKLKRMLGTPKKMKECLAIARTFSLLTCISICTWACADATTPKLVPGRFVYQIPAGYLPPRVSPSMIDDLQHKAASQKYPFYVVLMDRAANDQEASRTGNRFLDDWSKYPNFDARRTSLFLVTFTGDRKYRLFPAPEWRSKLGLEKNDSGDSLVQFTDIFLRDAKAGDPMGGISELMSAYSTYIFDRVDPKRVAQLAKARREAAERQRIYEEERQKVERLQQSQRSLDSSIDDMAGMLANQSYLPSNTNGYRLVLAKAKEVRARNNPEEMDEETRILNLSRTELMNYMRDRMLDEKAARDRRNLLTIVGLGILGILVGVGAKRRSTFVRERSEFKANIESWKAKVSGARLRYYDKVYNKDNEFLAQRLKQYSADTETSKFYQAVVQETDNIISQVEALSIHFDRCEALARRSSILNLGPLRKASFALNESFEFDTDQISSKLMDPISTKISVNPHVEEENLNRRFEEAIRNWDHLKIALSNANIPASELFKHDDLNQMIADAEANGIPLRWLKKHPLFGSSDDDSALYTRLDAPRTTDPILYCREVERNMAIETGLKEDLRRLIAALTLAKSEEITSLESLEGTVLAPDDDPKMTLDRARQNQDRLAGLLQSSDSVEEVEKQAEKVDGLFRTCRAQLGAALSAIASAYQEVDAAKAKMSELDARSQQAQADVEQASLVHSNMSASRNALEAALRHLESGSSSLTQAEAELANRSHLASVRLAQAALDQFAKCDDRFDAVIRTISDLEQAKLQYERKLREMGSLHDDAVEKVRTYNGYYARIEEFRSPTLANGPADYGMLIGVLTSQEQSWNTEVLNAKRDYDLEIARQLAEARRRREEEEERSRSSLFSSNSSSSSSWSSHDSGSSWSSSSGDSGGSWSSGSSSSGGGDSGGSW